VRSILVECVHRRNTMKPKIKDELLRPHERIDDLQLNGLYIIQDPSGFCFGMDAVLLSDFARPAPGAYVADLGTGTGILPLLMSAKTKNTRFEAVEINSHVADMAQRSVALNGLQARIRVHAMDLKDAPAKLGKSVFDYVVCNPPYRKLGSGKTSTDALQATARYETNCTLQDVIIAASSLLQNKGRMAMICPCDRVVELFASLCAHKLQPKRVRMIHSFVDRAPKLMMIESIKSGKPFVQWMPPLVIYDQDGSCSRELNRIYGREEA
jgi:tRNA1Val (adenine37-N6)-methyltransferase